MDGGNIGGGSKGNSGGGSGGRSGGGSWEENQPEAGQFDTMYCEAMMLSTGESGSENKWMADSGSSHHLKSDTVGMFDIQNCPEGMKIHQVEGILKVQQWGSILLEVDGHSGKRVIKLSQTLVVPGIRVNLFSLQRVVDMVYVPVFGEIDGKVLI